MSGIPVWAPTLLQLLIRSLSLTNCKCFSFTFFVLRLSTSIFYSLWWVSVVFWVNPLVLISVLEVVGNIIGCSHKAVENITVLWVVIQVLLGSSQRLELLNGEVVVGDLGESEWLFVDSKGVHLHWYFFVLISFNLLFNLRRRFEVLLIKGHWELV